jgi:hypothetical protein
VVVEAVSARASWASRLMVRTSSIRGMGLLPRGFAHPSRRRAFAPT